MRIVVETHDPVRLSFLTMLLADAGIKTFLLDPYVNVVGEVMPVYPRRLAVREEDETRARRVLTEAGEA